MGPLEPTELRRRRRALGLTRAQLAERMLVTSNTVARWGRDELHMGRPRQVARVLERLEGAQKPLRRVPQARREETSLRPVRYKLPAELTSFVERGSEIGRLHERLASARLVRLVGPGGVGKSRLALQVAWRALNAHRDGLWLVQLDRLTDGRMAPSALVSALRIHERGGTALSAHDEPSSYRASAPWMAGTRRWTVCAAGRLSRRRA